ncbi:MAG: UDP-3-O-(3-hydroxymyristoyl)glucosamine N-acyltransferase [Planctomycetes bacterium]|nr:UDP-3-O-(3-hydroxymyristoyl)glucosamine N-acyltransferase [Planctomycetota bacterium]
MDVTLKVLAARVGGTVAGDPEVRLTGLAGLESAGPGDLCFLRPGTPVERLAGTRAAAVVVAESVAAEGVNLLRVRDPERVFNEIARQLGPKPPPVPVGVHPTAVVDGAAHVDPTAAVGPGTVIEAGAEIGPRTQIGALCYVGHRVRVGADCRFFPRVVVREDTWIGDRAVLEAGVVVGSDGFGWEAGPDGPRRIPQVGRVVLEDDVELGANTTVDRARLDETRIGRGTKLDNLVQVGHNVRIGAHNLYAAQVGIAGTVRIGDGVEMGGQVGISGHLEIGDGVQIGAQSGVMRSVEPGQRLFGSPAVAANLRKRLVLLEPELPGLFRRVKVLEQKVARLEEPAND